MELATRRILIIGINYWPELTGIGKYTGEMAEWLSCRGWEVRVVTAPPYYPAWKIAKGYSGYLYRKESIKGVAVTRCPLWVPNRPTSVKRILHLGSFAATSLPVMLWTALRWKPNIVFAVAPPLFCAPGALLAAKLSGARAWLHIQDFEVDAAFGLGMLSSRSLKRLFLAIEKRVMGCFDTVSTISEQMLQGLRKKGIISKKTIYFPNWSELDRIKPINGVTEFKSKWGINDGQKVVLYSGNMGQKQGLEIVFEAAKLLKQEKNIKFVLCGDGAARQPLEKMAYGMPNILFGNLQPVEKLNDLLNTADIHILPQRQNVEDLVLPSKLTNMLASGRPVVTTSQQNTQLAKILKNCGIVVKPGDAAEFAAAIRELSLDSRRCRELGIEARKTAENLWDKEKILGRAFPPCT